MTRTLRNWCAPLLILAVTWLANCLHFLRLGLYEDDWFFIGYSFSVSFKQWMVDSLWAELSTPEASVGRPVQHLFNYTFSELGALTGSLATDYVLAYLLTSAVLLAMYYVLHMRFSRVLATVATLLFAVSPMHTLHQSLIYQFSLGPSFLFVLGAIVLYARGKRAWSYLPAALSLLNYESVYFLFVAAPLMRRRRMFKGRWREWMTHTLACALIAAAVFLQRALTSEARVSNLPHGMELVRLVLNSWLKYSLASFTPYYYGALRAYRDATAESWIVAWICAVALTGALAVYRRQAPAGRFTLPRVLAFIVRPAFTGLVLLVLGYTVSYFILGETNPRLAYTDRVSRVSLAPSFGSSIFLAAIFAGLLRLARSSEARSAICLATSAVFGAQMLYAMVLQDDYVKDWSMQTATVRQFMALTPDVAEDSILILRFPSVDPGLPGQAAIGADQDGFDEVIKHIYVRSQKLPTLFIVVSDDWPNYLKRTPEGFMEWKAPFFPGRWYPSSGKYRPGRFIVLDEQQRGHMVRKTDPIVVDGVDIVQRPGVNTGVWSSLARTPLYEKLLGR